MSDVIITVENLGKKYQIRHQAERQRYTALRDVFAQKAKSVVRGLWSVVPDSSFRIQAGGSPVPLFVVPRSVQCNFDTAGKRRHCSI